MSEAAMSIFGWSLRQLARRFPAKAPPSVERAFYNTLRAIGLPVYVGYGLTETSPVLTLRMPSRNVLGTIGRAVPEVELQIRHPETRAVLPAGEVGVVWTRGPQVMRDPLVESPKPAVNA